MKSLPPESDENAQKPKESTDFWSLQADLAPAPPGAGATTKRRRGLNADVEYARQGQATPDYKTLTAGQDTHIRLFQRRTFSDWLIEFLTPFLIFIMMLVVLQFVLDVRFIYTEVHNSNLRLFSFAFLLGAVALNRVIARDGKDESVIYIFALGGVVVLYTFVTSSAYDVGSVARNFMNTPGFAFFFNLVLVMFLWWVVNRLTHECCVDTNPYAGEVGIFRGTARTMLKSFKTREKKIVDDRDWMEAIDPSEYVPPKPKKKAQVSQTITERLPKRHPGVSIFYVSVPVMIIFALGQRVVQHGGHMMMVLGNVYIGVYTFSALTLLMLTSLGGLREYFRSRYIAIPKGIAVFWLSLGLVMVLMVCFGAIALPKTELPLIAYVDQHQTDYWTRYSRFELLPVIADQAEAFEQSRFLERVGQAVLVILGLFVLYGALRGISNFAAMIARNRLYFPAPVRRFFDRLDRFLMRLARLPALPRWQRARRVSRNVSMSVQYRNPMADPALSGKMTRTDIIEQAYDALCALAYDMGVPRQPGQTPFEFIEQFPKEMRGLKPEAYEITNMFVQAKYGNKQFDENSLDRVRKFWMTYERIRGRVVR